MMSRIPPHGLDGTCEECGLLYACCHCDPTADKADDVMGTKEGVDLKALKQIYEDGLNFNCSDDPDWTGIQNYVEALEHLLAESNTLVGMYQDRVTSLEALLASSYAPCKECGAAPTEFQVVDKSSKTEAYVFEHRCCDTRHVAWHKTRSASRAAWNLANLIDGLQEIELKPSPTLAAAKFDISRSAPVAVFEPPCRWIPVTERLPEDGEKVVVLASNGLAYTSGYYTAFNGNIIWMNKDGLPRDVKVTHWMPLPEPPKG